MKIKPCFEEISGFNDRWIIIAGLPIASVLVSLLLFGDAYERLDWSFIAVCIPMSLVYTTIFWFGMRWIYSEMKWRHPTNEAIGKRILGVFLGFIVLFFVVDFVLHRLFNSMGISHGVEPNHVVKFIASLILCALVITLYEAISFYIQLQRTVAEKAQLERQNIESQLEGLRNQVNPHFLFNSLNTLAYLIPEDADKAVRFLQQLSNVYRYVLESREAKVIPLSKELEFLDAYVFLLKERFGENLQVEITCSEQNRSYGIVPLSLQMLFENVIKHNVISVEKPLHIQVFCENGQLIIRNNLQRKNQVMDSTGVGLQNIRDRYRMLTEKEVEVIESHHYFTVALPIIEVNEYKIGT
ncbi:MAG: histidine kinase [Saprospiraceae bacterium]|nr:histidine kinase [Lewinellaceae bacterium]MBP6810943.1 histidine kinase [Saprospiraceae bacterium]